MKPSASLDPTHVPLAALASAASEAGKTRGVRDRTGAPLSCRPRRPGTAARAAWAWST